MIIYRSVARMKSFCEMHPSTEVQNKLIGNKWFTGFMLHFWIRVSFTLSIWRSWLGRATEVEHRNKNTASVFLSIILSIKMGSSLALKKLSQQKCLFISTNILKKKIQHLIQICRLSWSPARNTTQLFLLPAPFPCIRGSSSSSKYHKKPFP